MKHYATLFVLGSLLGAQGCSSSSPTTQPGVDSGATDSGSDAGTDAEPTQDAGFTDTPVADTPSADLPVNDGSSGDSGTMDVADAAPLDAETDGAVATDSPPTVDGGTDAVATDVVVATDAPSTGDVPTSDVVVPPTGPCATANVVNLNTAGTLAGATTTYMGNNSSATSADYFGGAVCGVPGYELALRYTTRATTRLRVSTANAGTPASFDTVVFATSTCAPLTSAGASLLGCDDDANGTFQSQFVTTTVAAGSTVFVVVAGTTPPVETGATDVGAFALTVTELPQVALGGSCDPGFLANYCVDGTSCVGSGATATCMASGGSGMPCRTDPGTIPCNSGLACGGANTCVPVVALGASCDPDSLTNLCPTAASCVGTGTAAICINDGTLGGACRSDPGTIACNAGLGCREGTCVMESAGYTESALATPTWIDACAATGGTHVVLVGGPGVGTNRDDSHSMAALTLPFTFTLYGMAQTTVWPDTNGYAQFGSEPADSLGGPSYIPSTSDGPVVAPFWDDLVLLDPIAPSTAENLCVATTGSAPNRAYVIEWLNAYHYEAMDTTLTFEAVLHETTNTVDFVYHALSASGSADAMYVDGSSAAIGLQSDTGIQFDLHTGTVSTATGVRFTPE